MSFPIRRLEEVCLIITDGKHGDCLNQENSGYYFISAKDVRNWNINYEGAREITQEDYIDTHKRTKFEPFDVVVVSTGANIGDVAIGKDIDKTYRTTFQKSVAILKSDKQKLLPFYLAYFLKNSREKLHNISSGSAQKNVLLKDLRKLEIPTPPIPTQQKIASILSAYDDLIENNLKRIRLLEEKAFLKYKSLDKIANCLLGDIYETSSGGTPSRTNSENFTGNINWFKSKELTDSILLESEEKITENAIENSSAKLFPDGAVILAMYGATIGKLGLLTLPSTTNQACCAIIEKDNTKSNFYILNWLLENRDYILSFRMGAAQENISQQIIKNLQVSIPSDIDLNMFNFEMESIYHLITNIHIQNTKLREARDILLPRLMNGEIEV